MLLPMFYFDTKAGAVVEGPGLVVGGVDIQCQNLNAVEACCLFNGGKEGAACTLVVELRINDKAADAGKPARKSNGAAGSVGKVGGGKACDFTGEFGNQDQRVGFGKF